jgi:prevent-host-death family protein
MDRMSLYDAKARFSELVDRAEQGRSTVITKRGRVVAKIVPAKAARWDRAAILDEAEALRRTLKVKRRVNLAKLIEEGRM